MFIKELMETTPENLAKKQHEALTKFLAERLETLAFAVRDRQYTKIENLLNFSPAGDGHGCDNYYIKMEECGLEDIGEVVDRLKSLAQVAGLDSKVKEGDKA